MNKPPILNVGKKYVPKSLRTLFRRSEAAFYSSFRWAGIHVYYKHKAARVQGTDLKLNIGCGPLHIDGWVNLDQILSSKIVYANIVKGIPIKGEMAQHIHSEHFIEHLEYHEALMFLQECFRVLRSGGTFRLIMPDAEKYIRSYSNGDTHFFTQLENLGGVPDLLDTPLRVINQMFRMGGDHKFAWDFDTLAKRLREIGFVDVVRSHVHDVSPELDIDGIDWWRPVESLYLNCRKP